MTVEILADEPFFHNGTPSMTKVYSDTNDYMKASTKLRKYMSIIEKLGTSIFAIDDISKSIVIEYIPGKPLSSFLLYCLDPWKNGGMIKLLTIIQDVRVLLKDLHSHGVKYDEVNLDNFVVMNSVVKMKNLDSIVPLGDTDIDYQFSIICDKIVDILDKNISNRQALSNSLFEEQRDSIYDLRKLMKDINV